jgi:hypothetical protein
MTHHALPQESLAAVGELVQDRCEVNPVRRCFTFLRSMVLEWSTNRGLADALAGAGIDLTDVEQVVLAVRGELLRAAQKAGVRPDVGVPEVKALMVGCQAIQTYNAELAERTVNVVLDGLRSL